MAAPWIGQEEARAVAGAMEGGWIAKGENIEHFEQAFCRSLGIKYAVAVSSGTAAVEVALRALGLEGKEVITTVHSCAATTLGMLHAGVRPQFVDIRPIDYNIDLDGLESSLTSRTAGILVVHCYGRACDMRRIQAVASRHGIPVIEDCAMALGAHASAHPVGTLGVMGCFSFYGNKIITTGEGGMVVTNDEALARKARVIRNYGQDPERPFVHVEYGYNFKLSNIHASIGLAQLSRLNEMLHRRRQNAEFLTKELKGVRGLTLPSSCPTLEHAYFAYPFQVEPGMRNEVCRRLEAMSIETRTMFPTLTRQPFYEQRFGRVDRIFPAADDVAANGLYVGCYPTLTDEMLKYLATGIKAAIAGSR